MSERPSTLPCGIAALHFVLSELPSQPAITRVQADRVPHHRVQHRISGAMPFDIDGLVQDDLEAHFPDFGQGRPLAWALAVGAIAGSWDEEIVIQGRDWDVKFYPPKLLKIPYPSEKRIRASMRGVPRHCCVLRVHTEKVDMNDARQVGRPAIRSLLALLRREIGVIVPADILWEGAMVTTPRGYARMSTAVRRLEAKLVDATRMHSVGLKLANISAIGMPRQLHLALEWLSLARSATVRSEKFMHLWLAVLTLASYKQPRRLTDMTRIRRYTKTMIVGDGGVRSPLSVAGLNDRFRRAYKIRNDLVHRADEAGITEGVLANLESDAFELVDFEFRKLGTPISA